MICLLPKRLRWSTGWNDAPCWGVRQALPTLIIFYVPSILCSTPPHRSQMLDCKRYNGVDCTCQLRVWCWSCTCVSSWCSLQGWLGINKGSYLLVVNFALFQAPARSGVRDWSVSNESHWSQKNFIETNGSRFTKFFVCSPDDVGKCI